MNTIFDELLVSAMHILSSDKIPRDRLILAHNMLINFVSQTEELYDEAAMTFNVHQLLLIVQSVINWGPLQAHSCYTFESGNGQLLKKVHAANRVISQIVRSVQMMQSEFILMNNVLETHPQSPVIEYVRRLDTKHAKNTLKVNSTRYFGKSKPIKQMWINQLQLSDRSRTFKKIVKDGCLYTYHKSKRIRSNNSYAITTEREFIRLEFTVDQETNKLLSVKW